MKNLEEYLLQSRRKKAPVRIPGSPILGPDTLDALQKAEILVKEAQKTILEASYDVASSPEREQSIRSAGQQEAEDEDALYIRDIVATRFYEANESARIFTRPSTRPLVERVCRSMVRQRRARLDRERSAEICSEESTTSRPRSMQVPIANVQNSPKINSDQLHRELKKPTLPQRTIHDEESPTRIPKDTDEFPSPWKIDNQTVANSFRVQQGPRVDIRNELTITNVEQVDISPQPRSSLSVQQNIKTYEFRHESCVAEMLVDGTNNASEGATSIQSGIGNTVAARDSLEAPEKSRDSIRKSRGSVTASQQQGSRPDLVENKSGRSIPPERLEGHADNVRTRAANRGEHVSEENKENNDNKEDARNIENRGECFMDFLRGSRNSEKNCKSESLKHKVFGILDTNDKINIFDRAIDEFFGEIICEERGEANGPSCLTRSQENYLPEKEIDGNFVEDAANETNNLLKQDFHGGEYFEEEWDSEEINLQSPNLAHLEKTLKNFESTMDEVLRGTRSLAALMSEYSSEAEAATRPGLINQDFSYNPRLFYSVPTKDISSDLESKNIEPLSKKASDNYEDRRVKDTIKSLEELIGFPGNFNEISVASRHYTEPRRKVAKKLPMEGESSKRFDHPRFSTPLNNDLNITRPCRSNADCKSNEFARFLSGIQGPRGYFESKEGPSSGNADFARIESRREDKIVLNRNEFFPTVSTVTRNDLELEKKIVLDEINRKCNFDSLFDRDRLSRVENKQKKHETQTFPNYPTREKRGSSEVRNSGTRSLIQDSAIGRASDRSEQISVGTKLIEDYSTKKDSSRPDRCAPSEKDSTKSMQSTTKQVGAISQIESINTKNVESTRTKTLTMKKNSVQSAQAVNKSEIKSSATLQSEIIDVAKTSDKENEYSVKDKETISNKNRLAGSPGSSLKDRTSFDISTAYSEDFEEPVASVENSAVQEKSESLKSAGLKLFSNPVEITEAKEEVENNRKDDSKTVPASSLQSTEMGKLHNESKGEVKYLDKSVSISVSKLSNKMEEDRKGDSGGSRLVELVTEQKGSVDCDSEMKGADEILAKVSEEPCSDGQSTAATSASTKVSATSSIAEESRREEIKWPKESYEDEVPKNFRLGKNLVASSGHMREGVLGKCDCKECTGHIVDEPNDALVKSSSFSTIETVIDDSLESGKEGELCISEEVIKALESETLTKSNQRPCEQRFSIEKQEHLCQAEHEGDNEGNNVSQDKEAQRESSKTAGIDSDDNINKLYKSLNEFDFSSGQMNLASSVKLEEFVNFESSVAFHSTPKHLIPSESSERYCTENAKNISKLSPHNFVTRHNTKKLQYSKDDVQNENEEINISRIDSTEKKMNKTCQTPVSDLEEITNFASSIMIDLTPKHLIENSRRASEEFSSPVPDPIPDDHANVAADTCSGNYSEGELYLPSSCSYSLGEIRISERGSCGTVGAVIQSSGRNADGMRIYFSKKNSPHNASDNTIKLPNSSLQSPGEVQETDVESIYSSQGVSSDGEHHMGEQYIHS